MLQLLRPNSSNLPCLCSTFHLEYPLVLSRFFCLLQSGYCRRKEILLNINKKSVQLHNYLRFSKVFWQKIYGIVWYVKRNYIGKIKWSYIWQILQISEWINCFPWKLKQNERACCIRVRMCSVCIYAMLSVISEKSFVATTPWVNLILDIYNVLLVNNGIGLPYPGHIQNERAYCILLYMYICNVVICNKWKKKYI